MTIKARKTEGLRSLFICVALFLAVTVSGNPKKRFAEGNKALAEQRFEDAVNAFQEAAADSSDAAVFYNMGIAEYRLGRFADAASSYETAASLATTTKERSRSWYNMGNCMVKTGEGLRETDRAASANYYAQAAWLYRTALDYDPSFTDAAYNLEVAQLLAVQVEEELKAEQEKEQQENELIRYIREKLQDFIERQTALLETETTDGLQAALEKETRELAEVMEQSGLHQDITQPDGTTVPGPLKETRQHTVNAAEAMKLADQPTALEELMAALGAAPEDPDRQNGEADEESDDYEDYDMEYEESDEEADTYDDADPFGDFSEYEEIRGVPPPTQTEMDILAEEVRNMERRKEKKAGEYKAVEKDW